ncbi:oxidase [Aspergillus luchuensis]|uniref:Oxidase n=1 Tax=Aspergillus kawachii TaxID=1069201 RepID=A0A146FGZ2_ASPKA|nr:oxidase [Aspergillus luchuensis]
MRISTTPLWIWPLAAAPVVAGFTEHSHSKHAAMHKRCPYANGHQQDVSGYDKGLLAELLKSPVDVYGMGVDLATVLALMGTVWTGNPLSLDPSFSIGGRDIGVNNLLGNLGGLLGA